MQSIKTFVSVASFAICMGAASMASAVSISPVSQAFSAPGSITVTSPASLGIPVTCNITFTGTTAANGANASITSATVSGTNSLCGIPVMQNLPWTLTPATTTTGSVSGVSFAIGSNCGTATIAVTYTGGVLSIPATQTVGSCKITKLSVTPNPTFTINP